MSLGLLAAGTPGVFACVPPRPPDRRVRVPLATLQAAVRLEVEYLGDPVELRTTPAGPAARSLLCTHFGCRVLWDASAGVYDCPCHQARFDAGGRPVTGPAQRPLRDVPVVIEGDDVLAGEP